MRYLIELVRRWLHRRTAPSGGVYWLRPGFEVWSHEDPDLEAKRRRIRRWARDRAAELQRPSPLLEDDVVMTVRPLPPAEVPDVLLETREAIARVVSWPVDSA